MGFMALFKIFHYVQQIYQLTSAKTEDSQGTLSGPEGIKIVFIINSE